MWKYYDHILNVVRFPLKKYANNCWLWEQIQIKMIRKKIRSRRFLSANSEGKLPMELH